MWKRLKKSGKTCSSEDARFLHLLFLGREPFSDAELGPLGELSFFGAMKRLLLSRGFAASVIDPFMLGKRPMQLDLSAEQARVITHGTKQHFGEKLADKTSGRWPQCLHAALSAVRAQKAFLKAFSVDRLDYLLSQLSALGDSTPAIKGAVHQSHGTIVRGFAARAGAGSPLTLEFFLNGKPAGTSVADKDSRDIGVQHDVPDAVGFSHGLELDAVSGDYDALLQIFDQESGAMICPPREVVVDTAAASQLLARMLDELDELYAATKSGDFAAAQQLGDTVARRLPQYDRFADLLLQDYPLYRRLYRPATPPEPGQPVRIAVVVTGGSASERTQTRRNLDAQTYEDFDLFEESVPEDIGGYDCILPLDAGDQLDPRALGWIAATCACNPDADIIRFGYDHEGAEGDVSAPVFVADFDPLVLAQKPGYAAAYAVHPRAIEDGELSSDARATWDRVWRNKGAQGYAAIRETLLTRRGAQARQSLTPLELPTADSGAKLAIIIPTKDRLDLLRPCVESLLATITLPQNSEIFIVDNASEDQETLDWLHDVQQPGSAGSVAVRVLRDEQPFNWAGLNNRAAQKTEADYLLFLNNDTQATEPGWDQVLRSLLQMPDAGVVGAKLLFEDGTVQHGGAVIRNDGRVIHEGLNWPGDAAGYGDRLQLTRTCEAVTGAFLACSRETFEAAGGFDAVRFSVTYNDIDFCLSVSEHGKRVVFTPLIRFLHLESQSRGHDSARDKREREKIERAAMHEKWPERAFYDRWLPLQLRYDASGPHLLLVRPSEQKM